MQSDTKPKNLFSPSYKLYVKLSVAAAFSHTSATQNQRYLIPSYPNIVTFGYKKQTSKQKKKKEMMAAPKAAS